MAQIVIMGNGDKDTGHNTITPPMFAEMFRFMVGRDVAVVQRGFFSDTNTDENYAKPSQYGYNWDMTANSADDITIDKGLAMIYGYVVYNPTIYSFNVVPPSSGNKYVWVYVQVDLSSASVASCTLDIFDKGNDNGWWNDALDDNLITNPSGKYVLPLYRLEINPSGGIVATIGVEELARQRGKNITVQTMVEISKLARLADEAKMVRDTSGGQNSLGIRISNRDLLIEL